MDAYLEQNNSFFTYHNFSFCELYRLILSSMLATLIENTKENK